jgi:hypothetical protein
MFKRLFGHVEVAHVGVLFGFFTLGTAMYKDFGVFISIMVAIVGLLLVYGAARNAYIAKSTALLDKYDERFSEKMVRERKAAALFLLGENSDGDELEDVLDFFETPIARKVSDGSVDAEQIYETFYHWIRLYYQASLKFIEEYRKREPAAYSSLANLYAETAKYEQKEIEKKLGRKCKLEDLLLSEENMKMYLRQEANLKTEPSDWANIFDRGES